MKTGARRQLIRLRYNPNFIRLKLPRACQSPASRAVLDDHELFLAPGLAKRRGDRSADPFPGVVSGHQD